ncbi:MAG: homocysteine S-methyltransferase family protein [Muribaculaceae bacterium]|nr:homocysteine S-methyltransferase family protein [Muribaculaceae bacterium]
MRREKTLILDGATGVLLQRGWSLSRVHEEYVAAGADIITTHTFNDTEEFLNGVSEEAEKSFRHRVRLAKEKGGDRVMVAGSIGPGRESLSRHPGGMARSVLCRRYRMAWQRITEILLEEGVDMLLLETVYDFENLKTTLSGMKAGVKEEGKSVPVYVSFSLTLAGKLLSGEGMDEIIEFLKQEGNIEGIGFNCGDGFKGMREKLRNIRESWRGKVIFYPNLGLPDAKGEYADSGKRFVEEMDDIVRDGLADIVGGCCGTTPSEIRELAGILRCGG